MIQLIQITDPIKLEEYHRFRYNIYRESGKEAFLKDNSVLDIDEYDMHAIHLGWYEKDKLIGCVRLLKPRLGSSIYYSFRIMPNPIKIIVDNKINEYKKKGITLFEVSRICLANQIRNILTVKKFVLAIMSYIHLINIDNIFICCESNHTTFWTHMGLEVIPKADNWNCIGVSKVGSCLVYDYSKLPFKIVSKLKLISNEMILNRINCKQ